MLVKSKIGGCHALTGNRKKQYAMNLVQPFRLVFKKIDDEIQIVSIIEIVNYH
ncbi:hypothetical protein FACS1894216_21340 [Synergistales bacterium]|nr:hypothetical protein FACS1894216_21340 [Synergistales bacterium]